MATTVTFGTEDRYEEIWSSQQVVPQHMSTDGSLEQAGTPDTSAKRRIRLVWTYTVYHRLSAFVIIANTIGVVALCSRRSLLNNSQTCFQAVAANLLTSTLIRQEYVINSLYYIFGLIPHSTPLCLRRHAANLYHLGGIHSGAAISASLWLAILNIAIIRLTVTEVHTDAQTVLDLCLVALLDVLLLQMSLFSLPVFRHKYHNSWESMHRWSGWLLLVVFWCYLALHTYLLFQSRDERNTQLGRVIYADPIFYLLSTMTFSIVLPWLSLRKVEPRYQKLSDHAVQLFFEQWYVSPCKTPRFSTSPVKEWHAFAGIPSAAGDGCSVIISRAGDWTSRIIDSPPRYLYTKGHPAQGVLYMAKIFKVVLCVVTGSGIAPVLGLLDIPNTTFKILWSARDPESTYSRSIVQRLLMADRNATILDTSRTGRSDLVEGAARIWEEGGIEAVFVISNAVVTERTVKGLRLKGILAHGPIFDS